MNPIDYWILGYDANSGREFPQIVSTEGFALPAIGPDGFPIEPVPSWRCRLVRRARISDVLSGCFWEESRLVSQKALEVIAGLSLGNVRHYEVIVIDRKGDHIPYTLLYFNNIIPPEAVDFKQSVFHFRPFSEVPKHDTTVVVHSFSHWLELQEEVFRERLPGCPPGWRLLPKTLRLLADQYPPFDVFRIRRFSGQMIVTNTFREACLGNHVSGVEFRPAPLVTRRDDHPAS